MTETSRRSGPWPDRARHLHTPPFCLPRLCVPRAGTPRFGALLLTGIVLAALIGGVGVVSPASAVPATNPGDKVLSASTAMEDVPAVVANPIQANVLAAAFVRGNGCFVRASSDAGVTWTAPVRLPASIAVASCVGAELAYAPDGNRLYAAYAEWGPDTDDPQINRVVAAVSTDGGRSWGSPAVVLEGTSAPDDAAYLQPQVATPLRASEANWVYVTAVKHFRFGAYTTLARSQDFGATWQATNDISIRLRNPDEMLPPLQATRHTLAAGPGGEVMLVSTCGGCDDAQYPAGISRDQGVRIWRSANFGTSFTGVSNPVYAQRGALSYAFPANVAYGWGEAAVGPAVRYGVSGVAHVVYPANGHLYYIWARAPFTAWSAPEQVDSGAAGSRQAPVLPLRACGATPYLHVVWFDTRMDAGGQKYDVFYAQRPAATGGVWSNNVRVSNVASAPDLPWSASALAVNGAKVFAVWPDRRDNGGYDLDIFGSTIASGLTCP